MIRRATKAAVRMLAFQYPGSDFGLLGDRERVWACREEIEGGEDEEAEEHARRIGGRVLGGEKREEAATPVGDVAVFVEADVGF